MLSHFSTNFKKRASFDGVCFVAGFMTWTGRSCWSRQPTAYPNGSTQTMQTTGWGAISWINAISLCCLCAFEPAWCRLLCLWYVSTSISHHWWVYQHLNLGLCLNHYDFSHAWEMSFSHWRSSHWNHVHVLHMQVYICGGDVHVIPLPKGPGLQLGTLPPGKPSVEQALQCLRKYPDFTLAAPRIQKDIQRRISGFVSISSMTSSVFILPCCIADDRAYLFCRYPEKLLESRHRTTCYIPASLAAVLNHSPALVAPIVQAFYHRDPVDLKVGTRKCTMNT